jgi:hypothetical protein
MERAVTLSVGFPIISCTKCRVGNDKKWERLAIRRMIQDAKDNYPQLIEKLERQRNGNSK